MADTKISNLTAATTPLVGTEVLPIVQGGTTKKVAVADLTAGRAVEVLRLYSGIAYNAGRRINTQSNAGETAAFIGGPNGYALIDNVGSGYSYLSQSVSLTVQDMAGNPVAIFDAATKNVSFYGNLTQLVAAKGINFTANTAAAGKTSQLLNWYEEGTFIPSWTSLTTVGALTTVGKYTRIGNIVYVSVTVKAATSTVSTANTTYFSGLPYSVGYASTVSAIQNWNIGTPGNGLIDTSSNVYTPTWSSGANQTVTLSGFYQVA